ncbi:hypothetical protein W02_39790 [Nitrospira sp. KM1]|uniref:PqqD family protein n=1 Tax=Nitrospira sp. KM1 TaxID=1936990 RepID=UPI0013A71508|nr:PqqD family protein [Nitrospira sp. KM1]BCA56839.1 hypothetical protein W02_39790 [Nitrospira sp. KM1]
MDRQPFITADLRPDMTVDSGLHRSAIRESATTVQLADAAAAILSEEELRQVDRGRPGRTEDIMATVPQPNSNVQGTTLDEETVLLDLSTGRYYTLNRVGSAIWHDCNGVNSLRDIQERLSSRFEAPLERIADDLLALVTQLSHEGLLTLERR